MIPDADGRERERLRGERRRRAAGAVPRAESERTLHRWIGRYYWRGSLIGYPDRLRKLGIADVWLDDKCLSGLIAAAYTNPEIRGRVKAEDASMRDLIRRRHRDDMDLLRLTRGLIEIAPSPEHQRWLHLVEAGPPGRRVGAPVGRKEAQP